MYNKTKTSMQELNVTSKELDNSLESMLKSINDKPRELDIILNELQSIKKALSLIMSMQRLQAVTYINQAQEEKEIMSSIVYSEMQEQLEKASVEILEVNQYEGEESASDYEECLKKINTTFQLSPEECDSVVEVLKSLTYDIK